MNRAQRHVVVVAIGVVCAIAARATEQLVGQTHSGWFEYSSNSGVAFSPSHTGWILRSTIVWLIAIAIWTTCAWRLCRSPTPDGSGQTDYTD